MSFSQALGQTTRRVSYGESAPAREKHVSIFEGPCDVIVKDRQATEFVRQVMLTTAPLQLIFDFAVLNGSPSDAQVFANSLERVPCITGRVPTHAAAGGGGCHHVTPGLSSGD